MVLGSGIRNGVFPDPGYRGQKGTGSRIRNTGYDGVLQVPKLKLQYKVIGFKNCFNYESLLEICPVKIANFTEVLNYNKLNCGSHIRAFIYRRTSHKLPPPSKK